MSTIELAAESQGVTHFVGRTLERFGFAATPIDTLGTRRLHDVTSQVSNDTWQLFVDLQTLNPHTKAMRLRLSEAQDLVFDLLLPNRVVTDRMVVGIQGGRGSFNEDAARYYMSSHARSFVRDRVSAHHRARPARAP